MHLKWNVSNRFEKYEKAIVRPFRRNRTLCGTSSVTLGPRQTRRRHLPVSICRARKLIGSPSVRPAYTCERDICRRLGTCDFERAKDTGHTGRHRFSDAHLVPSWFGRRPFHRLVYPYPADCRKSRPTRCYKIFTGQSDYYVDYGDDLECSSTGTCANIFCPSASIAIIVFGRRIFLQPLCRRTSRTDAFRVNVIELSSEAILSFFHFFFLTLII